MKRFIYHLAHWGFVAAVGSTLIGCNPKVEKSQAAPTLPQAVDSLSQQGTHIVDALRAMNPSAADEAIHDSMYLADRLPLFLGSENVDGKKLAELSGRLNRLLMDAHQGAHGSAQEWDAKKAADEIEACFAELRGVIQ